VLPLRASTSVPGESAGIGDVELEAKKVVYWSRERLEMLAEVVGRAGKAVDEHERPRVRNLDRRLRGLGSRRH